MRVTFDSPFADFAKAENLRSLFVVAAGRVERVRALNDREIFAYDTAMKRLNSARQGDIILVGAERNWSELVDTLIELEDAGAAPEGVDEGVSLALDLNRRLANYLGLLRLYLDFEEKRIKRTYGKDSLQVAKCKEICRGIYDAHFCYRFAYRLRNYAQHHGFPVGHIIHHASIDAATGTKSGSVSLCFDVDELLQAEKEVWRSLATELRGMGPQLDVIEVLDPLAGCVRDLRDRLRAMEMPQLQRDASIALNMFRDAVARSGTPYIGHFTDEGSKLAAEIEPWPVGLIRSLNIEQVELSFDPSKLTRR